MFCLALRSCFCFFLSPNVSVLRVSGSFNPPTHVADGSIHCSQKQQSAAFRSQDVRSSICLDLTPLKGGAEWGGAGLRGDSFGERPTQSSRAENCQRNVMKRSAHPLIHSSPSMFHPHFIWDQNTHCCFFTSAKEAGGHRWLVYEQNYSKSN